MNDEALLYMTSEGWIELGMSRISHSHHAGRMEQTFLNDNPPSCTYESRVGREPQRIIQRRSNNGNHNLQMFHEMKYLHPHAVLVTHERVFYPSMVEDNYPLVGTTFLKISWDQHHLSYNKRMKKIRGWFKEGFGDLGSHEFTQTNL